MPLLVPMSAALIIYVCFTLVYMIEHPTFSYAVLYIFSTVAGIAQYYFVSYILLLIATGFQAVVNNITPVKNRLVKAGLMDADGGHHKQTPEQKKQAKSLPYMLKLLAVFPFTFVWTIVRAPYAIIKSFLVKDEKKPAGHGHGHDHHDDHGHGKRHIVRQPFRGYDTISSTGKKAEGKGGGSGGKKGRGRRSV